MSPTATAIAAWMKFDAGESFSDLGGDKGTAPGQFDLPHSIVVGPDGRVYVCGPVQTRASKSSIARAT